MRFRIIALPLAVSRRPLSRSTVASEKASELVYYHLQSFPTEEKDLKPPNVFKRGMDRAVQAWKNMGLAPEGNWKRRIYGYGESLMDRVDFEETSLKSLSPPDENTREANKKDGIRIPLIYPASLHDPLNRFTDLINYRAPFHNRGFWTWTLIAPLTAPFALVPVIPNLPFFFCVWRLWSHRKAYNTSSYLQELLKENTIVPESSADLTAIYNNTGESAASKGAAEKNASPADQDANDDRLLLSRSSASSIVSSLGLKDVALTEIMKALDQARLRMAKEGKEKTS